MSPIQQALSATAYALFAFEQPLALDEIAQGARAGAFPAAATHTPEWFAAAAEASSLLDMAPELRVLADDSDSADEVDVSGIDLIRVYAPEMQAAAEEPEAAAPVPVPAPATPRTSTQLGLLKELGNLDD